jgi:predicted ribonuclease YlaK
MEKPENRKVKAVREPRKGMEEPTQYEMDTPEPKKAYVLDTSVLIHDPESILNFQEHDVHVPLEVINELDRIKSESSERGQAARAVQRKLLLYLPRVGNEMGTLPTGGHIGILMPPTEVTKSESNLGQILGEMTTPDHRILATAQWLKGKSNGTQVVVVSKDMGMALKARAVDLDTEDYKFDKVLEKQEETPEIEVSDAELARFASEGWIELEKNRLPDKEPLEINSYGLFRANKRIPWRHTGFGRFVAVRPGMVQVPHGIELRARNLEQVFLLDALLNPEIHLVTVAGLAGTGKTLLTMAAALQMIGSRTYTGVCISKPTQPIGKESGFLPGPQPLIAKILTPTGWTTMGAIKVGDMVIAADGKPSRVRKLFPQGKNNVFEITTKEGKKTQACGNHPWLIKTYEEFKRKKGGSIKSTEQISQSLKTKHGKPNARLPRNGPAQFGEQAVPIPAYTLGALLGDGYLGDTVSLSCTETEIIDRVRTEIRSLGCKATQSERNYHLGRENPDGNKQKRAVRITEVSTGEVTVYKSRTEMAAKTGIHTATIAPRCERGSTVAGARYEYLPTEKHWENPVKDRVSKLGLLGKKAPEKFIPDIYKYNSVEVRQGMLRGLMDTDGGIKTNGECAFYTTSPRLAADILEIVLSLGGKGKVRPDRRKKRKNYIRGREIRSKLKGYTVGFRLPEMNPFHLKRKAERFRTKSTAGEQCDYIVSVEPAGVKETQCILIDHPSHLYITDDYIVTHNSIEEKMRPWLQPYADALNFLHHQRPPQQKKQSDRKERRAQRGPTSQSGSAGQSGPKRPYDLLTESGVVEITALEHIRGRSIPNRIFVADELQNVAPSITKTITSRIAEGSKLIYLGDLEQIDNPYLDRYSNGLSHVRSKMRNLANAAHITLKKGERSLLAEQAAKLL